VWARPKKQSVQQQRAPKTWPILLGVILMLTTLTANAAELITRDGKAHRGVVQWQNRAFLVQGENSKQVVTPDSVVEVRFNAPTTKAPPSGTVLTLVDGSVQSVRITSSSRTKGLRIGGNMQRNTPILYYKFDSLSKGVVRNLGTGGAAYDGERVAGADITTGKKGRGGVGEALSIADNSGQYIRPRTAVPTPQEGGYTIAAWFQNLHPTDNWRTLTRANTGAGGHHIIVNAGSNDLGVFHGGFGDGGGDLAPGNAKWKHIAGVCRDGETWFYIDGKHVGTSSHTTSADIYAIGNYHGGGQPFAERIDDFCIFDRALSPSEIQLLIAKGALGISPVAHVPLDRIQSIDFNPVRCRTAPKIPSFKDGQVHIVRIDGTVVTGEFSYVTPLLVGAKINGKRERFRRNALAAIHFRPPAAPKGDGFLVRTTLGARILGSIEELTSNALVVKSPHGKINISIEDLLSIERVGSHVTPLSALKPVAKKETAFLDLIHPSQMDKDLFGFPLQVGALTYARGISMHSRTELVFDTHGAAVFTGVAGLDTRNSRTGAAKLAITIDGKTVHTVDLKHGEPFQYLNLPLGTCKKLGLFLDYGALGSSGDHALILNPRLVKR